MPSRSRRRRENQGPKEQTLSLTTGHLAGSFKSDEGRGAYYIHLRVTLDAKGAGKGTLEFDPNNNRKYNGDWRLGSPVLPPILQPARSKYTQARETDEKGRLLYEHPGATLVLVLPVNRPVIALSGRTTREHPERAAAAGEGELKLKPCHPGCFPAKTNIRTPGGTRAIETIRAGDQVLAVDKKGNLPRQGTLGIGERGVAGGSGNGQRPTHHDRQATPLPQWGNLQGCRRLDAGRGIAALAGRKGQPTKIRAIRKTKQLAQVFNLVLEDQEYFIAGDFLVRSKPPLTGEAIEPVCRNRAGNRIRPAAFVRQDTEPIQGAGQVWYPVHVRYLVAGKLEMSSDTVSVREQAPHCTRKETQRASDEFPRLRLAEGPTGFRVNPGHQSVNVFLRAPGADFRVVGTILGGLSTLGLALITEKARSEFLAAPLWPKSGSGPTARSRCSPGLT